MGGGNAVLSVVGRDRTQGIQFLASRRSRIVRLTVPEDIHSAKSMICRIKLAPLVIRGTLELMNEQKGRIYSHAIRR